VIDRIADYLKTILQVNILVSRSERACLADFGLATAGDSKPTLVQSISTSRMTGTLRWQAPELFPDMSKTDVSGTEQRETLATDIYAFAFVCYEVSQIFTSLRKLN